MLATSKDRQAKHSQWPQPDDRQPEPQQIMNQPIRDVPTRTVPEQCPVMETTPSSVFSPVDQLEKMRKQAIESNELMRKYSQCTEIMYTFDGSPFRGITPGCVITVDRVTRPIRLVSRITGNTWSSRTDSGAAFAYRGHPFGAMYSWKPEDGDRITVRCTGMYEPGVPEFEYCYQRDYQPIDVDQYQAANQKLDGPELKASQMVAVTGEEVSQDILETYGKSYVWLTAVPGVIAKGKYKGEPTVDFRIDGFPCGNLTALQGKRRYKQIPETGAVCLAQISKGNTKWELNVYLPEWE